MTQRRHAKGDKAWGECGRSGERHLLRDLIFDGHIPGMLVHPNWWEPQHPQETLAEVYDPIALEHPSPRLDHANATVQLGNLLNPETMEPVAPLTSIPALGQVSVQLFSVQDIDPANQRGSALSVGKPWMPVLPFATGTIDQADRQQVAACYSGILAA